MACRKELLLVVVAISAGFILCQQSGPVVNTNYGSLEGLSLLDRLNRSFDAFYGIPFAQPPTGSMRWKAPQAAESWDGIRNATEFGPHCTQIIGGVYVFLGFGANESEDCLYLNVYVPVSVDNALSNNLPVMFYFYGGAYLLGTSEMYPAEELAVHGEVIVVTTTYRVGAMGFLSTADDASPGNYALWDAKAALEWTNENIAYFGGDTDRITVFGHSAGAGMTVHSLLSPQTNHLFQRAIAISGSATGITGYTHSPLRTAQYLADLYFCNTTDTTEIVNCLMDVDAKDLETWGLAGILDGDARIPDLIPVIDGQFVVQDTRKSFEEGVGKDIDFMTGHTIHDGMAFALANPLGLPPLLNLTFWNITEDGNRDNQEIYDMFILFFGKFDKYALYELIVDRYPDINSTDRVLCSKAATDFITFWFFTAAGHFEAEKHSQAGGLGSSYIYEFQHLQSFLTGYPDWAMGSHMDDIYSVLGDPFMKFFRYLMLDNEDFSPLDQQVNAHVMNYYSNFAYTGNPNDGPHSVPTEWPEYDPTGTREFLVESPSPFVLQETAELIDEYNWFLYEFWPLMKPEWQEQTEKDQQYIEEKQLERVAIDEDEVLMSMARLRDILYGVYGNLEYAMDEIDSTLESALLSREYRRPQSW